MWIQHPDPAVDLERLITDFVAMKRALGYQVAYDDSCSFIDDINQKIAENER
ncbi:MAG: hypothetical protein Q4A55_06190 [Aerococcus sp.]|nr:hypothetical protein [Aerococcus sp.]